MTRPGLFSDFHKYEEKFFAIITKFLLTDGLFVAILIEHVRGERRVMRGSGRLLGDEVTSVEYVRYQAGPDTQSGG